MNDFLVSVLCLFYSLNNKQCLYARISQNRSSLERSFVKQWLNPVSLTDLCFFSIWNDGLIVPSQCFQNKLVFLSLWIRVLLFPLHFVLMRAAIWFHCSLKHGESNFLCKTDTRKPNFPLSNCWKPLVPDVWHLAISSSGKRTSKEAL